MADESSAKNNSLNKVIIMTPLITDSWEITLFTAINTVFCNMKEKHVSLSFLLVRCQEPSTYFAIMLRTF